MGVIGDPIGSARWVGYTAMRLGQQAGQQAVPSQYEAGTFERALEQVMDRCWRVMLDRQRKYGPDNINFFGEPGVVVRLHDKLARLRKFYFNDPGVCTGTIEKRPTPDETLEDTWIDVVNYGLIGLLLRAGKWGKPLADDLSPDSTTSCGVSVGDEG